MSERLDDLLSLLGDSPKISCLTGAGISAPSGVPTFRGETCLWKNFRPEELATPQAFSRQPALVWEWYDWRRGLIAKCEPNRGHQVLAEWSRRYKDFTLITQNVDGLHERAGTENVIRFHGSIWLLRCWDACEASPAEWWDESESFDKYPPPCPYCSGYLRPGVVWFGEGIDHQVLSSSVDATNCDIFLSIGTSAVVYPAAGLIAQAKSQGAYIVEINLEPAAGSSAVDLFLQGSADQILAKLEKKILEL